jgi:hypothetical protein
MWTSFTRLTVISRSCGRALLASLLLSGNVDELHSAHCHCQVFKSSKLILTQDTTFVTHPALPVTWSTNLTFYVISVAITSICTEFQLIWSNRTHSDPRCYFRGISSTSSSLVHKLNVLCHFCCHNKYMYRISAHLVQ